MDHIITRLCIVLCIGQQAAPATLRDILGLQSPACIDLMLHAESAEYVARAVLAVNQIGE